jgi:AcrR family transcriptional regulator
MKAKSAKRAQKSKARRRTQAERSGATRAALVAAARPLFAERGYAGVGAEQIVHAAGVTRGALYHHFGGKPGLLEAVYRQIEEELTEEIVARAGGASDPLEALRLAIGVFMDACMEPDVQRTVLLDGPAVLGWERWREIAADYGLGLFESSLQSAIEAGQIAQQPAKPLAHLLMGALDEAALLIARADDPKAAKAEVTATLDRLLDALSTT